MMYSIEDLKNPDNGQIALKRYLHKFVNQRKEVKKFKLHEKDFLFSAMRALISLKDGVDLDNLRKNFKNDLDFWKYLEENDLAKKGFSLYEIEEANDFLFYIIVLNYFDNLTFLSPTIGPYGPLSKEEIRRDLFYFNKRLAEWETQLFSNKGVYIPHILNEYKRKKRLIEEQRRKYIIGNNKYLHKLKELAVISFHIFYKTKYFFDNQKAPYYGFTINNVKFIFNIYSYVHILSRHYIPSVNDFDIQRSFNNHIPFVEIDNMPISIEALLKDYSIYRGLTPEDQFIIFQYKSFCYILWFDFRYIDALKEEVTHIRTFYKIKEKRDIDKCTASTRLKIHDDFHYFI